MADSRYTKNNASTGQVWSEAYADNLDDQLDILSKRVWYVDDQVWITSNAQYNGSAWERIDTAKPAWGICLDASSNLATINLVAAGSNPIAGPDMTVSIDSSGNLTAPTVSGNLIATKFTTAAGDTVTAKSGTVSGTSASAGANVTALTATVPAELQGGSTVRAVISTGGSWDGYVGVRVLVNGVEVYVSSSVLYADIPVSAGDEITVQMHVGSNSINAYVLTGSIKIAGYDAVVGVAPQTW